MKPRKEVVSTSARRATTAQKEQAKRNAANGAKQRALKNTSAPLRVLGKKDSYNVQATVYPDARPALVVVLPNKMQFQNRKKNNRNQKQPA